MSGSTSNPGSIMAGFNANLLYALFYLSKVLNDSPPISDKLDNLTELDKRIKALKQNFKDATALGNGFDAEKEFTQQVLQLDERVRILKTSMEAIKHAAGVLMQASRRSPSPHTPTQHTLTPKQEAEILTRLSSPIPFATMAGAGTPSPRLSDLAPPGLERSSSTRSASPYSQMTRPSQEDFMHLNDDINELKVKVEQYYNLKSEQKHNKQGKNELPILQKPRTKKA